MKMELTIKLTLLAIIRAEQQLGKPFSSIDYTSESDLKTLLYCMALANNETQFTMEEFLNMCENGKQMSAIMTEFERQSKILEQFKNKKSTDSEKGEACFMDEIVATLIVDAGLSAHYVLNEMMIQDIDMYMRAFDRKKREEMESQRLWTYHSMRPHMDSRKFNSPKKLVLFPWEQKEKIDTIKNGNDSLEEFLKGDFIFTKKK